jgi:hypothetical protein
MNIVSNFASFASLGSVTAGSVTAGNLTRLQPDSQNGAYYTRGGQFLDYPSEPGLPYPGLSATMGSATIPREANKDTEQ